MVRKHQFENLNGFVLDLSFSVGPYQFFICYHIYLLLLQEIGNPTCIGSTYRCSICGLPIFIRHWVHPNHVEPTCRLSH